MSKIYVETFKWENHFLNMCLCHAGMSKDPSSKMGALIVGKDKEILSVGFNGFPRDIEDSEERLNNREMKHKLVVHAETNAILAAARTGVTLRGSTIYFAGINSKNEIVSGPCCVRCAVEIIQAGIKQFVSWEKAIPDPPNLTGDALSDWRKDLDLAKHILQEAGVIYREIKR